MRRQGNSLEKNVCRKFQKKRLFFVNVTFQICKEKEAYVKGHIASRFSKNYFAYCLATIYFLSSQIAGNAIFNAEKEGVC